MDGKAVTVAEYEEAKRRHPGNYPAVSPGQRNAALETIIQCRQPGSDPITEDVRQYLREHFEAVKDLPSDGKFYVFSVQLSSGQMRLMKVHRDLFIYAGMVPKYLRDYDFAAQLERGDVEITTAELS